MEDDEFDIDPQQEEQQPQKNNNKSMKMVYEQLQQKQKGEKKEKKIKKVKIEEKTQKKQKKTEQHHQPEISHSHKGDPNCKYIRNKALEAKLKQTALTGVLRIMNMISKTQQERAVQ